MSLRDKRKAFIDPVCGMTVKPTTAAPQTCYNGIPIYFCGEACRKTFDAEPQKFKVNQRKGFWRRYLERLNKATGGRPPACH